MDIVPIEQMIINSSELPQGYELSNYVIERKLGHGGFGITYLARETATNRAVVIKENFPQECSQRHSTYLTVGPSSSENTEYYEWALTRFIDEAKVLMRLEHTAVVPVLAAFKALGTAYYVMPLVEGQEIHMAAPAPDAIDEAWLRPVLLKLLQALDYLHGQGLLHRDIKPSNILMRAGGSPLLIDFGTARSLVASRTLTRVGTPGFSPAEQFTDHSKNGSWTDIYSLGATCYCLITGEIPQDAVGRLVEDTLLPLASRQELQGRFSVEFLSAIDKALCISCTERWQSAQEWLNKIMTPASQQVDGAGSRGIREFIGWRIAAFISLAICSLIGWSIGGGIGKDIGRYIGRDVGEIIGRLIGGLIGWTIFILIGGAICWAIAWAIENWLAKKPNKRRSHRGRRAR